MSASHRRTPPRECWSVAGEAAVVWSHWLDILSITDRFKHNGNQVTQTILSPVLTGHARASSAEGAR